MTENGTQPTGTTSSSLLIELLTPIATRIDYSSRKVLPYKSVLYDLLMASIFLLRSIHGSKENQDSCLEYANGLVSSALARLNGQPITTGTSLNASIPTNTSKQLINGEVFLIGHQSNPYADSLLMRFLLWMNRLRLIDSL
jgi:hypothetical protein